MFAETNLHSLINRVAGERGIALGKLLRESLLAATDDLIQIRSELTLPPDWRERRRHLAAIAEAQRDWGWWHKPPWTWLKLLLVKEADYASWLDRATDYEAVSIESENEPKLRQASEQIIDQTISAE